MTKLLRLVTRKDNFLLFTNHLNLLITVVAMSFVVWLTYALDFDGAEDIQYWLNRDNNILAMVFISIVLMLICAMTPLPAEAVALANGMLYGPLLGSLITWLSAILGAYLSFIYSRRLLQRIDLNIIQKDQWQRVNRWMHKWGVFGFLLARLVPLVPFFALNIGAAFLPISKKNYLLITSLSILPHIFIICFVGGNINQYE